MPITRTTMIDDDGTGTTGTILNNAWLQTIYGQIDALAVPAVNVPYSAANYTAAGATWVPSGAAFQATLRYQQLREHRLVCLQFDLGGNAAISAATSSLFLAIPGMPPALATAHSSMAYWIEPGIGMGLVSITGASLAFNRDIAGTSWPAQATVIHYMRGQIFYTY